MTTRESIIVHAQSLFAQRGYDGVSVRDIARAAHVNVAAVSYHFGSKQGLFQEVISTGTEDIRATLSELAGQALPVRRKAELLIEAYMEFLIAEDSVSRIIMSELAVGGGRLPAVAGAHIREVTGALESIFRAGMSTGELRGDFDVTLALFSFISTPVYMALAQPIVEIIRGTKGYSHAFVKQVALHTTNVLFDGLAPRPAGPEGVSGQHDVSARR